MTAQPGKFVNMPAGVTIPSVPDEHFPVRHADWKRIRSQVARVGKRDSSLSAFAWTSVGISASATLAYFPWLAAYDQLPAVEKLHYSYMSPMLAIVAIAFALLSCFCFLVNRRQVKFVEAVVSDIVADMDAVYGPHKQSGP